MTGEVVSVDFQPDARAQMDVATLERTLRDAIGRIQFRMPSLDVAQSRQERLAARSRQTDQVVAWMDGIAASGADAPTRTATSEGGTAVAGVVIGAIGVITSGVSLAVVFDTKAARIDTVCQDPWPRPVFADY